MISCKRSKFSLPSGVTYLNCAYMSPLLKSVEKVGIRGVRKKRNPAAIRPDDFFGESEELRKVFAELIHADDAKRIAIIPAVSYGLANVVHNLGLRSSDEIVVAADQFPSNYYCWEDQATRVGAAVKIVKPPDGSADRGKGWNERILDAITPKVKVVALAHVHWADGTVFDLEAIRERTAAVNAALVVDGTQSIGALPFDCTRFKPDAVICAGYKWLLGPYSIGLAYYGERFSNGIPIEQNWINRLNSEDFTNLVNYQPAYQEGALRYDVGERSNFVLVPMLLRAIQQLNRWGVENIQSYCQHITHHAVGVLRENGFWIEDERYRSSHLFGVRLGSQDIEKIRQRLARRQINVSFRGNAIRVSPHLYNEEADLSRLCKALIG